MLKRQGSSTACFALADKLPALLHGYAGWAACLTRRHIQMIFPLGHKTAQLTGGDNRHRRAVNIGQVSDQAAFTEFAVPDLGAEPGHRHCFAPAALKWLQSPEQFPLSPVGCQLLQKILAVDGLQKPLHIMSKPVPSPHR